MSIMFLAAMMMAQAPAAAVTVTSPVPAAQKQKPRQVCEYIEITGSRSKKRVCRDEFGVRDLGPGVSNSGYGKAKIEPVIGPVTAAPGGLE